MSRMAQFGEGASGHTVDHLDTSRFKGHGYEDKIEFVPTHVLDKHKEYDREVDPRFEGDHAHLDEVTKDIAEHGVTSPLIMTYGQKDRRAYIGEGNHRLAAAKRLGITHLPVRVYRASHTDGRGAPVPGVTPNEHGYVKGDMKPSEIGLPVHGKAAKHHL